MRLGLAHAIALGLCKRVWQRLGFGLWPALAVGLGLAFRLALALAADICEPQRFCLGDRHAQRQPLWIP